MVRSTSARLAALESARGLDRGRSLEASQRAIDTGAANLADYRRVLGRDAIVAFRGYLMGVAHASVACRQAGLEWEDGLVHVVGYQPDTPLPQAMASRLDYNAHRLTAGPPTTASARRNDPLHRRYFSGELALDAALLLLAIGDNHGLQLRRRIWEEHDNLWRLSSETTEPSTQHGTRARAISQFWPGSDAFLYRAIREGGATTTTYDTRTGTGTWINFAELARVITATHTADTTAHPGAVKSSQNRSTTTAAGPSGSEPPP